MSTGGGYDGMFRPDQPSRPAVRATGLPPELDPRAGSTPARPSGAGRARRAAAWIAGLAALGVLGVSGVGYAALNLYDSKITREDVFAGIANRPAAPEKGEPVTILLVGSDSREGLTRGQRNALSTGKDQGQRSDTMILMHLSADNSRVTMVSLPRDSYVTIPAHTNPNGRQVGETKNKINASFFYGGPNLTIRTIEQNTGITIDHYVEVDIAGFVKMVDALGGAKVCVTKAVRDKDSGLRLPKGTSRLDGAEALAYVRARHIYPDQDLGRIRAQQAFIGSLAREALSADTLTNPIKLNRFLDASLSSVTTDQQFDKAAILQLAGRMRDLTASQITFLTVPLSDVNYRVPGVGSSVLWNRTESQALFDKIRNDQPVTKPVKTGAATVAPGKITVQVQNGAGITGLGARAADDLARVGFGMAGPAKNADVTGQAATVVRYDPGVPAQVKALPTLLAAIPGSSGQAVAGLGSTMTVVVGSEWTGAKRVRISSPTATPKPTSASKTAADTVCT